MTPIINMIGLLAALLTTISMVPQVVKVSKTKNTKDLSLMTFAILSSAIFLCFIYGLLIRAFPIIIGNAIGFILTTFIVMMKIKHG